jgi:hypothetical protein
MDTFGTGIAFLPKHIEDSAGPVRLKAARYRNKRAGNVTSLIKS